MVGDVRRVRDEPDGAGPDRFVPPAPGSAAPDHAVTDARVPDSVAVGRSDGRPSLADSYTDDSDDIFDIFDVVDPPDAGGGDGGEAEGGADGLDTASLWAFDPGRANLPTVADPAGYIAANRHDRPWLSTVAGADPEVQRVFAALDSGGGHAHTRHEGFGGEEAQYRRVTELVDPADPADPTARNHRCDVRATRIHDPAAFAVAFARAVEHPGVRAALDADYDPDDRPDRVSIPIAELLGTEGHRHCSGVRLVGNQEQARADRRQWVRSSAEERVQGGLVRPEAVPIGTFEGGTVNIFFRHDRGHRAYEVTTLFPSPAERSEKEQNGDGSTLPRN